MASRRDPVVAQVVLLSFVLDTAVAARPAPSSESFAPARSVPSSSRTPAPPPASAAGTEACDEALLQRHAPVTTLSRTRLWPPNHALIDVGLALDPTPECVGIAGLEVAVWSDERDDAPTGDGTTTGDARFDQRELFLRAERAGDSDGRVYLVIARGSTPTAEGFACRTVVVPHSGSPASLDAVNQQAAAARAVCDATGTAPPSFFLLAEAGFSETNQPPSVGAGPDLAIPSGEAATLDGTASDDGLPDGRLDLEWTQVAGPGHAAFSATDIEDPAVTFSVAGTYVLRLTASDGALESHDEVVVIIGTANEGPAVHAGEDQTLVLPANVAHLQGIATDDGRPNGDLSVTWSAVSMPSGGAVVFSAATFLETTAAFSMAGTYVLRLTAFDGQLSSADDVLVVVHAEAPPILTVGDHSVAEGNEGRGGGELHATLSKSWPRPVTVDFMTSDGSATAHCDYTFRYGTLTFEPGQTEASVLVPVMGELAPETAETVLVRLGNATEATLAGDQAVLTIVDDDAANHPPTAHAGRTPANHATGIAFPPTLSWQTGDPDAGDTVVHDIFLGPTASLDGQSWSRICPATAGPGPSSIFGFDDAADRLIVLEQMGDGSTGSRVWVLDNATGAGGHARWTSHQPVGGPDLAFARAAYDADGDRLIVVGRCNGACAGGTETWVLENASGSMAAWRQVAAPGAPEAVTRFATAYSEDAHRLFLFGGIDASGTRLGDLWILDNPAGSASWRRLDPADERPRPRDGATLVLDHRRNRLLLFGGGIDDATATNEVWVLDGPDGASPAWHRIEPDTAATPAPRLGHAAAYDAGTERLLVFGGTTPGMADNSNFVFADAWLLDGATWTRVPLPSPVPAGRFDATVVFSPLANRLIVGAGHNNKLPADPSDLWVLNDAMGTLPAAALGQEASSYTPEGLDPSATYLWRIVTRDVHGAVQGSATWRFTGNSPPVVDAGGDQEIAAPILTAQLVGSAGDDGLPAGSVLTLGWSLVAGPGAVTFSDAASSVTAASFSEPGVYLLRLRASDSVLAADDVMTVTVTGPNRPPVIVSQPHTPFLLQPPRGAGQPVDLRGWTQIDYETSSDPPGLWVTSADGTVVTEMRNAEPTILLADVTSTDDHLSGSFRVATFGDDDLIGLVFGYQDPTHFYLFDWKMADQDVSLRGMSIKVVNASTPLREIDLWPTHGNGDRVRTLFHNSIGWEYFRSYRFSLEVHPGEFTITVKDGANVIESVTIRDATYSSGRMGFYNYSQALAEYSAITREPLPSRTYAYGVHASDPDADPILYSVVGGPPGMTIDPSSGLIQWPVTSANLGQHPITVQAQDTGGLAGTQAFTLSIETANRAPDVDAGTDQAATLDCAPEAIVSLNGAVVDDGLPLGNNPALTWSLVSGPGSVTFTEPGEAATTARFTAPGTYVLRLAATDSALVGHDDVTVVVTPFLTPPGPLVASGFVPAHDGDGPFAVEIDGLTPGAPYTLYTWGVATLAPGSPSVNSLDLGGFIFEAADVTVRFGTSSTPFALPDALAIRRFDATAAPLRLSIVDSAYGDNTGGFWYELHFGEPPEEALAVAAGPDQSLRLPQTTAQMTGTVADLAGRGFSVEWSNVAGPAPVTIAEPGLLVTPATVSVPGNYVLRLEARNCLATAFDDVTVTLSERPDLTVTSVDAAGAVVNGQALTVSGHVLATITNAAAEDAGAFEVVVYEDRDGHPGFTATADNALGAIAVSALAGGASTNVLVAVAGNVLFRGSVLRVFADSSRAIDEVDEGNNDGAAPRGCEQPGGCTGHEPDLIPSFVRRTSTGPDIAVAARIGNAGTGIAPPPVVVGVYDGPPSQGRRLGIATTTAELAPGAYEDIVVVLPSTISAAPFFVAVDDPAAGGGTVAESIETNNVYDSRLYHPDRPNDAPVVTAGPDQVLDHPLLAALLAGAATDDGVPGGPLSFRWRQLSGPAIATIADAAAATTSVVFSISGTYAFRLEADDGERIGADDVTIQVDGPNAAPRVNAGADQSVTSPRSDLAGTVSDDGLPRGSSLTLGWSQMSGPGTAIIADAASTTTGVVLPEPGTYIFQLEASDSQSSATDVVAVVAQFVNRAPVVNAGADRAISFPLNSVGLSGIATDDDIPVGAVLAYSWSQVSGPSGAVFDPPSSSTPVATFGGPGAYVLRLTVSDGVLAGSDEMTVEVQGTPPSGPAPVALLASPAPGVSLGQPTLVRGTASSGTLASWRLEHRAAGEGAWTRFGFGTSPVDDGELAAFDPTLLLNGLYHLRLVVTDTSGRSAQASTQVVVRDNFKVGHFTVSFVDLEVPVAGMPIQVGRTYDSRDKRPGDFGPGWRLDLSNVRTEETGTAGLGWVGTTSHGLFPSYCLQQQSPMLVAVTLPGGLVFEFDAEISPSCRTFVPPEEVTVTYRPRPGTQGTLLPIGGNVAAVIGGWPEAGGSAQMQLFRVSDYSLFNPDSYELRLPDGRAFAVSQVAGLQRVTDLNGNVLTVDRNGITHSSGRGVTFVRNPAGGITAVRDPEGRTTTYAYSPAGDLAAITDRAGHVTRFRYHPVIAHQLESIQDPMGRTPLRNEYDDTGRLKRHIDAFGKVIEYTHAIGVRQEIVKDRNDKQRVLEYDERGNVVREIDPTGKAVVRTFDARNNRLTESVPHTPGTPTPPTTVYVYDADDNVTQVTDAENNRTEYTYNGRKQVRTTKDPLNRLTENTYDALTGNLLSSKDALGQVTSYTYDGHGNVATQTVIVDGVPQVTRYEYDTHRNLTREIDALGHETSFTHDANGNRLTQTTTRGIYACTSAGCTRTSVQTLTTTFIYDLAGRLLETRNPDGSSTRTVYDALGRQAEAFDALGHRTTYEYDLMGRLTRTTFVDGTFEESTYDNEGRRLTGRDREGGLTAYAYDDVGRLVRTTFPDATFTESTYDDAGRLVASRDARGKTTTYGYDRAGRRTSVKDPLQNETVFGYDANGNQTTVRDALRRTTTYEYDALNRRTKTTFPDLTFTTTTYDVLGRRRSETDQAGKTTSFEYDKVGRLLRVRDAAGKETSYTYDELGNRIAQRDANGRVTSFEYDAMGRETARILPDGSRESREYDSAGNVLRRVDFMGRPTTYAYDASNCLLSRSYPDASQDVGFTYTRSGRRLTATDARGVTTYGYDARQRLASLTYPDGRKLEYGYDASGNRSRLVAVAGTHSITAAFAFDDAGRLDVVTDPVGREYDLAYDANGNRDSLAYPNGTVTDYTYNTLNRMTDLATTHPGSARTIQRYGFTLGPAGNRTAISEADGTVRAYTYDDVYRLTAERVTVGGPIEYEKTFTYDDVGNRLTQVTAGSGAPGSPIASGSLTYTYDTRDRLLTETLGANPPTAFGYDANGNLITKSSEATYTWDFENRLIRVTKADGTTVDHAYDADGNRVRTRVTPATGPPAVTNFLVDTSGSLSHVVAETDDAGTLRAYYVRGDDLLAVMRPLVPAPSTSADWQTRFVHADGIGSIRRLTDEAGLITDGYTYTAFGELVAHTGTDPQPYAFAGEPYDPNSGFQYHRARWMDPRVGRFASGDAWRGSSMDPASLHLYLYAANNVANAIDSTGWFTTSVVGIRIHQELIAEYLTAHPAASLVGMIPTMPNRLFPDIADLATQDVIEIKPFSPWGLTGFPQVEGYIWALNAASHILPGFPGGWHAGTWQPPPGLRFEPTTATPYLVVGTYGGVLLYYVPNRVVRESTLQKLQRKILELSRRAVRSLEEASDEVRRAAREAELDGVLGQAVVAFGVMAISGAALVNMMSTATMNAAFGAP